MARVLSETHQIVSPIGMILAKVGDFGWDNAPGGDEPGGQPTPIRVGPRNSLKWGCSGSSKRQGHKNFQIDKQKIKKESLRGV